VSGEAVMWTMLAIGAALIGIAWLVSHAYRDMPDWLDRIWIVGVWIGGAGLVLNFIIGANEQAQKPDEPADDLGCWNIRAC
jgi:hypothetical protein